MFENKTAIEFSIAFRKGIKRHIIVYSYCELMFYALHVLKLSPVRVACRVHHGSTVFLILFYISKVFPVKSVPSSGG